MKKVIGLLIAVGGLSVFFKNTVTKSTAVEPSKTSKDEIGLNSSELLTNMDTDSFQTKNPQLVACSFNTCN